MLARFGERASIGWHIDSQALACRVPTMSLQPLLENVFKHTVERRRSATRIDVTAVLEDDAATLRLVVEDDGGQLAARPESGMPGGGTGADGAGMEAGGAGKEAGGAGAGTGGIGLANLRERLAMLHGADASLRLEQLTPAGVRATLRLPALRPDAAARAGAAQGDQHDRRAAALPLENAQAATAATAAAAPPSSGAPGERPCAS